MADRTYYVICKDNCLFEGMTKEQIYDAIADATGSTPTSVDDAFITMIKEQNAQHNLKIWKGTEAEYNALTEKSDDTLYLVGTNKVTDMEGIQSNVSIIQSYLQDMFVMEERTFTIKSFPPNLEGLSVEIETSKNGYKYIGCVGVEASTKCVITGGTNFFDDDYSLLEIRVFNLGTTTYTNVNVVAQLLYVKEF